MPVPVLGAQQAFEVTAPFAPRRAVADPEDRAHRGGPHPASDRGSVLEGG